MHQSLQEVFHLAGFPPYRFFTFILSFSFPCYLLVLFAFFILLGPYIDRVIVVIGKILSVYQTQNVSPLKRVEITGRKRALQRPNHYIAGLIIRRHYMVPGHVYSSRGPLHF